MIILRDHISDLNLFASSLNNEKDFDYWKNIYHVYLFKNQISSTTYANSPRTIEPYTLEIKSREWLRA